MKKRNLNLDVIRIFAFVSVICVHFFKNTGYYTINMVGKKMLFEAIMQQFFMICVPLFIILTGYLCNKKVSFKKYYLSIIPKMIIYILTSCVIIVVLKYYDPLEFSFSDNIKDFLSFNLGYSWYINMYLGLFILIPYLNILFNNIKSKKEKDLLLFLLLLLTCVPSVLKLFRYQYLFSNFWTMLYPITYYFIGSYISEYGLSISKKKNYIYLIVTVILFGSINYLLNYGHNYGYDDYCHFWGGIFPVILSILVFNLLLNIKFKFKCNKFIIMISNSTFAGYLISYIFDLYIYNYLNIKISNPYNRIYYFFIVAVIIILSLIFGYLINSLASDIYNLLIYIFKFLVRKINLNKENSKLYKVVAFNNSK